MPPDEEEDETEPRGYLGLAAFAAALAEWVELEDFVLELYAARRRARDRAVPDLGWLAG